ncbi:ATP-binding protein [Streptomyces cellostaticus]|uniref:ATP-binding protein n=1 Tax=Streptomyces TaxID=1883 RepID=UPI002025E932|nr:ATP-binding protein [Streptomyces cellostaticus]
MTPAPDPATATSLPIGSDADLAWVRHQVRRFAAELGFGLVQQTKLVTAASELARNTLIHGGGGEARITPVTNASAHGLRLSFIDTGPGIHDVELATTDGYTTGGGLGLGLSGARRLVDEFSIDTTPGAGTVVTLVAWVSGGSAVRPGSG